MNLRTGLDIVLQGKPAGNVEALPEPKTLFLPLQSRRFSFSALAVKEGQRVQPGEILATDPDNHSVPLLAPRAGTVRLGTAENHIVLEDIAQKQEPHYEELHDEPHARKDAEGLDVKRHKLLTLGAWQFFYDAHTELLPHPTIPPRAVIVSTVHMEPFSARGDVQMTKRLSSFTRGLEHLQSLLEYQPMYLVMPSHKSALGTQVLDAIRGYAWAKVVHIPLHYPCDNFASLARSLGLQAQLGEPVWAMRPEGVLAVDRALTLSQPSTVRIISLAGPAVTKPTHLKALPGYPLKEILAGRLSSDTTRIIDGGVFTGRTIEPTQQGLDTECTALTVLDEQVDREFLGFTRPGSDRRSYSPCFASTLRKPFTEGLTTGLRGERRPCVACGFCEEVCPAGIMPYLIHKTLYQGELEDAEQVRVDLCVGCGLCSFVCPSKIDLRGEFLAAQQAIRQELHAEEVQA